MKPRSLVNFFNELYWDICEMMSVDIKEKNRKREYTSGRVIFITIIAKLCDLENQNIRHKVITNDIIAEYLGLTHGAIIVARKKGWITHDKISEECLKAMMDKYHTLKYQAVILQIRRDFHLTKAGDIQYEIDKLLTKMQSARGKTNTVTAKK